MTNANVLSPKKQKPRLSFWQIWHMSFGFLGIQFGFALQNANVSRIFQTLGADIGSLPILWIAGPITGLLVQPIIGYMSDRTWTKLGRRKPYFLVGAILASASLFIMPNSPYLWFAAGMLWIMDASINISMEPFRAFVGDNLPSSQRTAGYAMQSFFIGVGAVIASMLPWIFTNWLNISNEAAAGVVPDSVKWSFYFGGAIFLLAVLWTIFKSKEYSPTELSSFSDNVIDQYQKEAWTAEEYHANGKRQLRSGGLMLFFGSLLTGSLSRMDLEKELYILSFGIMGVGLLFLVAGYLQQSGKYKNSLVIMLNDLQDMPDTMRQLAWVQFFSWFALFSMWIYTTAAVTSHIYGTSDASSTLYNEGADWVGICFAVYNGVAALVAFLIPVLAAKTNRKTAHIVCLLAGAIGLMSIFIVKTPMMLLVPMIGVGIAWASILSMPYAMLTSSLPSDKMGYYMGVFNFFIVIPQIVAATILGFIISRFFGEQAIYAMLIGGISFVIAAALTLRVRDED